ncbi:MAG TPA: DUF4142 domain-containing protein [Caulobacteraceae bacterium]|nr:DUF4142 domain-containing protein [Caulobacteraceae bacterium]
MTRSILLAAAAVAALTIAACQKQEAENPGQSEPVNAAQDAVGAAVGAVSASTLGANTVDGYVTNAAISDMYEIQAGQLASEKGVSAEVKKMGAMLVKDHTATSTAMKAAIAQGGVTATVPTELDQRRKGMIDNLRAASGADFDKVFLAQQTAAHSEALTLHQGFAENSDNPALKQFAAQTAPKIQHHLEEARRLEAGGTGAAPAAKKH